MGTSNAGDMYQAMFLGIGVINVGIFVWAFVLWRRSREPALALTLIPVFFFAWDNFRIAAGPVLGFGVSLYWLTWPAYWAHWLCGSWLIIASGSALRLANVSFVRSRWVMGAFCLLATGLTLRDLPQFWTRDLYPLCDLELIRYGISVKESARCSPTQAVVAGSVPITPVIACMIALGAGVAIWIRQRIPWLALGSIGMLIAASPIFSSHGLEYLGEAIIEGGLVASVWSMTRRVDVPETTGEARSNSPKTVEKILGGGR